VTKGLSSPAALQFLALAAIGSHPLVAQRQPVAIAVLPFEDRGSYGQDKEIFRALALGIPATLASELSGHPELRLVDRARIAQAIQSQGLKPGTKVDAATAARIGSAVGAQYAVSGSFEDFYGRVRLDARIVNAETGEIVKVVSNNDPTLQARADLFRIIRMVAHRVLAETANTAVPAGKAEAGDVPTEALDQYSLGLLYETGGNPAQAGEHYQKALSALPTYRDARDGLQRVRNQ
jgi:TolB-like protein